MSHKKFMGHILILTTPQVFQIIGSILIEVFILDIIYTLDNIFIRAGLSLGVSIMTSVFYKKFAHPTSLRANLLLSMIITPFLYTGQLFVMQIMGMIGSFNYIHAVVISITGSFFIVLVDYFLMEKPHTHKYKMKILEIHE